MKETDVVHLDTHVVAWLYAGVVHMLSERAAAFLERHELRASPWVLLELQSWRERGLLRVEPKEILADLERRLGLHLASVDARAVVEKSLELSWAKDPYDRLIVAHASLAEAPLVTKDGSIHAEFPQAVW